MSLTDQIAERADKGVELALGLEHPLGLEYKQWMIIIISIKIDNDFMYGHH